MNMEFEVEKYTIPKMLTVKEAAQEFHLPATAIREWIGEGSRSDQARRREFKRHDLRRRSGQTSPDKVISS